eukprot:519101_1
MGSCSACSNSNDKTKHNMAKQETKNEFDKHIQEKVMQSTIIDIKICESNTSHCFAEESTRNEINIVSKCDHLLRLVSALNYYSQLNLKEEASNNHDIFTHFCIERYRNVLNDYIHLIEIHNNHLQKINEYLITNDFINNDCQIDSCKIFARHYDDQRGNIKKQTVSGHKIGEFVFYTDLFDTIHHYLYHLFDIGLRIKANTSNIHELKNISSHNNENCIDQDFLQKKKIIEHKRKKLQINRFNDSNKFTMALLGNPANSTSDDEVTLIDSLFHVLNSISCPNNTQQELHLFLKDEQYDSDALLGDVTGHNIPTTKSNVLSVISDKTIQISVKQYINDVLISSHSFSAGIIWFYWSWYKGKTVKDVLFSGNENDYGGYEIEDLLVEKIFVNYKAELLHHLSMEKYNALVMLKATKYMSSDKVKQIRANNFDEYLHYGIEKNSSITIQHIMSIIVYCDFTKYSTKFSKSFRKASSFEPINLVKKRNRYFYWESKILRETVEIYGHNGNEYAKIWEKGPFYSGVNCLLVVPSFSIRLCSPTSTSKQFAVGINFAKKNGIIIQINNNGNFNSTGVPFFDCSWVSTYGEEDERLFVGGFIPIRVETIQIIKTSQNFYTSFHALFVLDSMMNGLWMDKRFGVNIVAKDIHILNELIKYSIGSSPITSFDTYVMSTWDAYTKNKKHIMINMDNLSEHFPKDIYDLVIESGIKKRDNYYISNSDNLNLMKGSIFDIFIKIKEITIHTTDDGGFAVYSFSLISFLSMLLKSRSLSWTQITITSERNSNDSSWVFNLVNSYQWASISKLYKSNQLRIEYTETIDFGGDKKDNINICRTIW